MPHRPRPQTRPWPPGSLLARLDRRSRDTLLSLGTHREFDSEEVLFHEGGEGGEVALLVSAVAKITCTAPDGRQTLLAIRVTGDIVGEMAALNRRSRTATVAFCSPAQVRLLSTRQFRDFLQTMPHAAVEVAGVIADRLCYANRKRVDLSTYPTRVRVARLLVELARAYGYRTPKGIAIGVRLSQPELAALATAAEITVQKALRELRSEGLIETGYRRTTVLNLHGLRAAALLGSG